jgi:hypothetical protein
MLTKRLFVKRNEPARAEIGLPQPPNGTPTVRLEKYESVMSNAPPKELRAGLPALAKLETKEEEERATATPAAAWRTDCAQARLLKEELVTAMEEDGDVKEMTVSAERKEKAVSARDRLDGDVAARTEKAAPENEREVMEMVAGDWIDKKVEDALESTMELCDRKLERETWRPLQEIIAASPGREKYTCSRKNTDISVEDEAQARAMVAASVLVGEERLPEFLSSPIFDTKRGSPAPVVDDLELQIQHTTNRNKMW